MFGDLRESLSGSKRFGKGCLREGSMVNFDNFLNSVAKHDVEMTFIVY